MNFSTAAISAHGDPAEVTTDKAHARAKTIRTARVIIKGHAFMQNLRSGHYELGVEALAGLPVAAAFD